MKHNLKKFLSLILSALMIMGLLSGCGRQSIEKYAKERLKEKYGEEFGIKTVYKDGSTVIAYPISDPDLLFTARYYMNNGNGSDGYLQEIIAKQFKQLVEEKFKTFKYNYYIDVDVRAVLTEIDTDITIEKYDMLVPTNSPSFNLYISCDMLSQSDEELYDFFDSIANIHKCGITAYFILNEDFHIISDDLSLNSVLSSNSYHYLNETRKYKAIYSSTDDKGKWISFEIFKERMKEVRSNKLYGLSFETSDDNESTDRPAGGTE